MRIVALVPLLLLASCEDAAVELVAEPTRVDYFMADPVALERGEALFIGSCAAYCHTMEPPTPDNDAAFLFDCEWIHGSSEEAIFDVIINGVADTRMVAFGSNFPEGEDDVLKIIAYIRANQTGCESGQ